MWIKVDDDFISHPKVLRAAELLGVYGLGRTLAGWLKGMSYAGRHQTDGIIPARIVRQIDDPKPALVADALVASGLWELIDCGYRIHDYHDYNPKAEKVIAARKAHLQRQQLYLAKRLERQAGHVDGVNAGVNSCVNDNGNDVLPVPIPSQSRPNLPTGEDVPAAEVKAPADWRDRFTAFWDAYPKKTAKPDAEKAFKALKVSGPLLEILLAAVAAQRASRQWQDKQFIPHPATWLRQHRWEDEVEAAATGQDAPSADASWLAECTHDPQCGCRTQHRERAALDAVRRTAQEGRG